MSCNEWKRVKLGDLIESISVKHSFNKNKLIFLNTSDILEGKVLHNNYSDIEGLPGQAKKSIQKDDILFSEIRPKNKRFAYVDFDSDDYVVSTKLMVLRRKSNNINNRYLYYYLTSDKTLNYLQTIAEGRSGTFPQITFNELKVIEINLPPLKEQEKIANILSSLDDKIELNNEMNKTLEEMAQSIFKRWFVDFEFPNEDGQPYKSSGGEMVDSELGMIPKGWEIKTIGDLCEVGSSKRIFMKEYVDSGVPFYRGKEIIEKSKGNSISTELFITKDRFEEIKEKFGVPNKNDILLTSVGTLGVAYLVGDEDFYFKDGNLTWFKDFKEEVYRYFIYQWIISSEGKKSIDAITIGSTQKALTINALKGMKLIVPSNDILSLFEGFIKSNISNIRSNNEEKNNLIDIRDSLLPKLMSGEIQI